MNLKPIIWYFKTFPETGLIIINFAICGIKRKKKSLPPIARTAENIILTIKKTKSINQMFPEANVMMSVAEGGRAGAYEAGIVIAISIS